MREVKPKWGGETFHAVDFGLFHDTEKTTFASRKEDLTGLEQERDREVRHTRLPAFAVGLIQGARGEASACIVSSALKSSAPAQTEVRSAKEVIRGLQSQMGRER